MLEKVMKVGFVAALAFSVSGCASNSGFELDPGEAVAITGGSITGTMSEVDDVAVYKGIPYAAAPVGDLRWQAPQPVETWDDVKACDDWGASAIQMQQAPFMMWSEEFIIEDTGYSEDCLNLNVWAKTEGDKDKPVVVYIHGGGFTSGGSSCEVYDGAYLASQDVVYVSINYRVGILGFLAHPELSSESDNGVSGNYGLLDQIAALNWVQENISQFGGDPDQVTIMGQSAGAASVNDLISSPLAAGLFNKAVSMSFNSLGYNMSTLDQKEQEGKAAFGDLTLEQMRAMSSEELMAISYSSAPIIDDYVLTGSYGDVLKAGTANDVALMSGMVDGDTFLFGTIKKAADGTITLADYQNQMMTIFGDLATTGLAAYPADDQNVLDVVNQFNIDYAIALQNQLAKMRSLNSENDTYLYNFSHIVPGPDAVMYGAFHTGDVPYFLNIFSDLRSGYWTDGDYALGEKMSGYLISFIKTGNPNGDELPQWPASMGDGSYQQLDVEETLNQSLAGAKIDFFNQYFDELFNLN